MGNMNRNERICYQKVVKRAKLTHVTFNPVIPILNVGDDRGGVNCLKLSPNLRGKLAKVPVGDLDPYEGKTKNEIWVERMEHLLEMVTEKGPPPRRRNAAPVESIFALAGLPSFVALF